MDDFKKLRNEIDDIDKNILELIGKRILLVRQIGEIKKTINKPVVDKKREEEKINSLIEEAKKQGVDKETVKKIWQALFNLSYKIEK